MRPSTGRKEKNKWFYIQQLRIKDALKVWEKEKMENDLSRNSIQKWREKGKIWAKEFLTFS
jgi:hypothetical protein